MRTSMLCGCSALIRKLGSYRLYTCSTWSSQTACWAFACHFNQTFLRQKAQDHEDFIYSAIVFILSLSQAVSLVYSSGSWQLFRSGIAPSGKSVQWQPGLLVSLLVWLSFWLQGRWLRTCLPPQLKKLIVIQHQVWKQDLQTDVTLYFLKFFVPFSVVLLCTSGIIRKLRKVPTTT